MKKFLATTALVLSMASTAHAEAHMTSFSEQTYDAAINLYASDLVGARVYATETEMGEDFMMEEGAETEWDDIGEINDILLNRDGTAQAVIVGVGGFLGIGERDIAITMDQLNFVKDGEDAVDYFVVINANAETLGAAPAFERAAMTDEEMAAEETDAAAADATTEAEGDAAMADTTEADADAAADTEMADTTEADADAAADTEMADTTEADADAAADTEVADGAAAPVGGAPMIERDGYMAADLEALTTEDLTGARIYGINDEDIGEVGELLLSEDGMITDVIVDIGGFLGIGEKSVSIGMDQLTILRQDGGDDVRVYVDSTQEALEALPEYEG